MLFANNIPENKSRHDKELSQFIASFSEKLGPDRFKTLKKCINLN